MALLAESLVDEWLNRKGFFTIRGVKHGVREMDIVAVCRESNASVIGWHVEVQVSFRPVSYICGLAEEIVRNTHRKKMSAKRRTEDEVTRSVTEWVEKKFLSKNKRAAREQLWPGLDWKFVFVHGVVRFEQELELIRSQGVQVIPFVEVLTNVCDTGTASFSGSAGGDLAEIVRYYRDKCPLNEYR